MNMSERTAITSAKQLFIIALISVFFWLIPTQAYAAPSLPASSGNASVTSAADDRSIPSSENASRSIAGTATTSCSSAAKLGTTNVDNLYLLNGYIKADWKQVPSARMYDVYRKENNGSWTRVGFTADLFWRDYTVVSGRTYTYTVRAVNNSTVSAFGKERSIVYLSSPKISGAAYSGGVTTVKWSGVPGAKYYHIYRKTGNNGALSWLGCSTGTSFADRTSVLGTKYGYVVRASSYNDTSHRQGYASGCFMFTPTSNAPHCVSALSCGDGVTVTWNASPNASSYRIYRKSGGSWSYIGSSSETSYLDKSTAYGCSYSYTVRAVLPNRLSDYEAKGVSVTCNLATPSFSVFRTSSGYGIEWDNVANATSYTIYRRVSGSDWTEWRTVSANNSHVLYTYDNTSSTNCYYTVSANRAGNTSRYDKTGQTASAAKTVVCVGDSITYGSGLGNRRKDCWTFLLDQKLGSRWSVLNCGLGGTTASSNTSKPYIGSAPYNASVNAKGDVYLIMLGTNDAVDLDRDQYTKDLNRLVQTYKNKPNHPKIVLLIPPYCYKNAGREKNIAKVITPIIREIAAKNGASVINLHTITQNNKSGFPDLLHPNASVNRQMAQTVYQSLHLN